MELYKLVYSIINSEFYIYFSCLSGKCYVKNILNNFILFFLLKFIQIKLYGFHQQFSSRIIEDSKPQIKVVPNPHGFKKNTRIRSQGLTFLLRT